MGEAATANQEAADEFPDAIQKNTKKGYLLEQVSDRDGALFWENKPQKTFLSKEEKRAQGLRQEGAG